MKAIGRLRRKLWSRVRASILLALLASLLAPVLLCVLISITYVPIVGRSASNWNTSHIYLYRGWASGEYTFDTILGSMRISVWSTDDRFEGVRPSLLGTEFDIQDEASGQVLSLRARYAPLWSRIREETNRRVDPTGRTVPFFEIGYGWPLVSAVSEAIDAEMTFQVSPGSGALSSLVRTGAVRVLPDRIWLPGAIVNTGLWFLVFFGLFGSTTLHRLVVLSRRWKQNRCLSCGHGMSGLDVCPECRTAWGELRAPIPAEAVEAGWVMVGAKGLRWIGWSVVPVVVLWLGLCALAALLPWLVWWNHYTSEFWTVLRWGGGVTLVASALCSAAGARGIVLCAEAEGRRLGAHGQRWRTVRVLLGVACGVIGSLIGLIALLLSSQRTFYSWSNWNDAIAGGIAVVLLAVFAWIGAGSVRRVVALGGDAPEGARMARRAAALLASCIVCGGFAWLSGMNEVSDVRWIWLVALLVCGFAAIEAVVFCVRFVRGCVQSGQVIGEISHRSETGATKT